MASHSVQNSTRELAPVLSQGQTPLFTQLQVSAQCRTAAFHTPGHKGGAGAAESLQIAWGQGCFQADLPELPELDNLFAPEGVIAEAQRLAAQAFGADHSWFLANGSTAGVMAAIMATCGPGDGIILPRNVHRSVISGLVLSGATPIFVQPDYDSASGLVGGLRMAAVEKALTHQANVKAVMLVSPTYEGICGETAAIAQLCHSYDIPLLVDEAHGPHFGFHPALPPSALSLGADLAVQSTHKVLSALTQASMLHLRGDRIDPNRLSQALGMVQSTSPNYLLLASLDMARWQMANQGEELMEQTIRLAEHIRHRLADIPGIRVLALPQPNLSQPGMNSASGFTAMDPTRLTVDVRGLGITGFEADELLNQDHGVVAELPGLRCLTFIVSLGNTAADGDRLVQGFQALAARLSNTQSVDQRGMTADVAIAALPMVDEWSSVAKQAHTPREAFYAPQKNVPVEAAIGQPSAETVCPYPPGIPALLPGEAITAEAVAHLQKIQAQGGMISGCSDPTLATLKVVEASPQVKLSHHSK